MTAAEWTSGFADLGARSADDVLLVPSSPVQPRCRDGRDRSADRRADHGSGERLQIIENMEEVYFFIEAPKIRSWLSGVLLQIGVAVEDLAIFLRIERPERQRDPLGVRRVDPAVAPAGNDQAAVVSGRAETCVPLAVGLLAWCLP